MKSFFQFLGEAQSQASMQAKKLNLKSDRIMVVGWTLVESLWRPLKMEN